MNQKSMSTDFIFLLCGFKLSLPFSGRFKLRDRDTATGYRGIVQ